MNVVEGWRFNSSDFSLNAANPKHVGSVTLIRCPDDVREWYILSGQLNEDDMPPLRIEGYGLTFERALKDANLTAACAMTIDEAQAKVELMKEKQS